jgi:hypothetical protein
MEAVQIRLLFVDNNWSSIMVHVSVVNTLVDDDIFVTVLMIAVAYYVTVTVPITISVTVTNRHANNACDSGFTGVCSGLNDNGIGHDVLPAFIADICPSADSMSTGNKGSDQAACCAGGNANSASAISQVENRSRRIRL